MDRKANNSTPNSRIKNQGLADEQQQKNEKQNKQTTRASNTRKLSNQSTKHTQQTTPRNEARPRREQGERVDQPKARKRSPPPPSCRLAILPDPRRSREGRAINKRGVGGVPFQTWGQENQNNNKEKETDRRTPRPTANHPGPRSTMDLDPGVEMQWAGGPQLI